MLKWIKERDIALLGSGGVQDVRPFRVEGVDQPVYRLCMAAVGTPLMGNCDLEALKRNVGASALDVLLYHGAPADTGCSRIARESIASF